jgi:hypothetical protein
MIDQNSRPARKVGIADHLWETFEEMAQQMGSDRDALINQALFMFARLNGFLEVGKPTRAEAPAPLNVVPAAPTPAVVRPSTASPSVGKANPPVLAAAPAPVKPAPVRDEGRAPPRPIEDRPSASNLDNDPVRREVAERVLETAAELERLIKGKNEPPPQQVDDDALEEEEGDGPPPEPSEDSGLQDMSDDEEPQDEEPQDEEPQDEEPALFLITEAGDQQKIANDRFVIGRGKHCDMVINSGKVSREHAVITREGADYFIEDLGSSNGTWYNKQRIKRRKIEDGDEYFICSEKIRLTMR